ncbi:hypothetical protein V8C37DRAFT_393391 [Trichoderma ceciliae]
MNSSFVAKWSSKPADHKKVRVRNNQRRHRERVKNRIAELESKLANTQLQLQEALSTIERLTRHANLDDCQPLSSVSHIDAAAHDLAATENGSHQNVTQQPSLPSLSPSSPQLLRQQETYPDSSERRRDFTRRSISGHRPTPLLGAVPSIETWSISADEAAIADKESGYECEMQPPNPKESTTRCRDAFRIIAEQNYACLEFSAVREWLQPGFHQASTEEDGCRVENKLLFTLLGYVSSV